MGLINAPTWRANELGHNLVVDVFSPFFVLAILQDKHAGARFLVAAARGERAETIGNLWCILHPKQIGVTGII